MDVVVNPPRQGEPSYELFEQVGEFHPISCLSVVAEKYISISFLIRGVDARDG